MSVGRIPDEAIRRLEKNCEANGACENLPGPFEWCDSCIAIHMEFATFVDGTPLGGAA